VDGLKSTEADAHGRGRLGDAQLFADLRDGGNELSGRERAHLGAAVARSRKRQHPVTQIGVTVGAKRSHSSAVPTGKDQHNRVAAPQFIATSTGPKEVSTTLVSTPRSWHRNDAKGPVLATI